MSKKEDPVPTFVYVLIGGVLIVLLKLFVFDGRTPFQDQIYDALNDGKPAVYEPSEKERNLAALLRRERDENDAPYDLFEDIQDDFLAMDIPVPGQEPVESEPEEPAFEEMEYSEETPKTSLDGIVKEYAAVEISDIELPEKQGYKPLAPNGPAVRVAIIIDDVGVSRHYSLETIKMDGGLTLAFLPYADHLKEMTEDARQRGHELMLHMPMEAMDQQQDLGPYGLRTSLERAEFEEVLGEIFSSFDGYIGINNHMGSRLTQDKERMSWVMEALKERGLYFVDSKTIHNSIAADVAQSYGVPFAVRHVFLDHDESLEAVRRQLVALEKSAYSRGHAIAIGHPKKNTLQAIAEWLPTMEEKGIVLVPASALIRYPQEDKPHAASVSGADELEEGFALDLLGFEGEAAEPTSSSDLESSLEHSAPPAQ